MPPADQVILFLNRHAGTGTGHELVTRLADCLSQRGFQVVEVIAVEQLDLHLRQHAKRIHAVVAAGGDGTAELVANHTPAGIPIGLLPLGTENLLAKHLRLEANPEETAQIINAGHTHSLDAGLAKGKMFLLMLSCGFDAEVVHRLHNTRQGNITHLSYARPIIDSIRSYDYPNLTVSSSPEDEQPTKWEQVECHWAFVFNTPSYAAGLQIVSEADPTDGKLEIATFSGGSFWHGLWQLSAVALGQHRQLPGFQLRRSNHVCIRSDHHVPYQVDGDPGGFLPVEIEVLPGRLTLLAKA